MNLQDKIAEMYNYYLCEFGDEPNELYIPERYFDDIDVIINDMPFNVVKPHLFSNTKHFWFVGMRVFMDMGTKSLSVGWSEETERLKRNVMV